MKNLEVVQLLGSYNTEISNPYNNDLKLWVDEAILFSDGYILGSHHDADCCESHYLEFTNINLDIFKGLKFDLSNENFFKRIPEYGIELIPINGHSIKIPGYGYNNGYYSSNIDLIVIKDKEIINMYDVSDCQIIS
jgi:hypothetical protein